MWWNQDDRLDDRDGLDQRDELEQGEGLNWTRVVVQTAVMDWTSVVGPGWRMDQDNGQSWTRVTAWPDSRRFSRTGQRSRRLSRLICSIAKSPRHLPYDAAVTAAAQLQEQDRSMSADRACSAISVEQSAKWAPDFFLGESQIQREVRIQQLRRRTQLPY